MSSLVLKSILTNPVNIISATGGVTIGVNLHQQQAGTHYYRLYCSQSFYTPTGFQPFFIYLGTLNTVPNYIYTQYWVGQATPSFGDIFTRYPNTRDLRPTVRLQSATDSNFTQNVITSDENFVVQFLLKGDSFAPRWSTSPSWIDKTYATNEGVRTMTGSSQKGCQSISQIEFTIPNATAYYGTSVEKYEINIKDAFIRIFTPSQLIAFGNKVTLNLTTYYRLVGSIPVTISVEDTRGMKYSVNKTLVVIPYEGISLVEDNSHREGGVGSTLILDISGRWQGSPISSTNLTCSSIKAYEEGRQTEYASIVPEMTVSGNRFSYSGTWQNVTFDPKKSYSLIATITDTVKTVQIKLTISVATPVMSIRNAMVGINNPSPAYDLDVSGTIAQNGNPILGFVKNLVSTSGQTIDLNDCTQPGIYYFNGDTHASVNNFPAGISQFFMLVIGKSGRNVVQVLWYLSLGEEYVRTKTSSSWKKVTMS